MGEISIDTQNCPYCAELIKIDATKCKHCGEWLRETKTSTHNPKTKPGYKGFFWTWIITLFLFFTLIFAAKGDFSKAPGYLLPLFLLNIVLGIGAFVGFLSVILNELADKRYRRKAAIYITLTALLFVLFFFTLANLNRFQLYSKVLGSQDITTDTEQKCPNGLIECYAGGVKKCATREACKAEVESHQVTPKPHPSNTPSLLKTNTSTTKMNSSRISCVGPDEKQFETTIEECTKLNEKWGKPVDYMVNCKIPPECGGGTKYIKKSECEKPCVRLTQSQTPSTNNSPSTNSGMSYFCVNNVTGYTYYTSSGEQCNLDNLKALCVDSADKFVYDPCMSKCLQEAQDQNGICIYNYDEPVRTECLAANDQAHQECMDECGAKYQEESSKCY